MVVRFLIQMRDNIRRRTRRAFLANPEKMPQRYAIAMASILFISIIVTYNVVYEKKKREEGVTTVHVSDLFQERNAKQRREHLELQRNIAKARDMARATEPKDL